MGGLVATVADGWCRRRGCLSYVKFRWDVVQDGWEEGGLCFEGKACTGDVFYVTSLSEVEESKRREEKT